MSLVTVHENKKRILRPLTIVHKVEFSSDGKAWGQGFAAFGYKFEGPTPPLPLGVFDTFPKSYSSIFQQPHTASQTTHPP